MKHCAKDKNLEILDNFKPSGYFQLFLIVLDKVGVIQINESTNVQALGLGL